MNPYFGGIDETDKHLQWFLELWDASHAVLGIISIVAIQRAIQKILIAVFLSREYKHDETNRAWWSGKWYGRGLGSSALSQPAREYVVKIVEMSLWSSDFLLGHFLLILASIPIFIPFVDRLHSTMLCEYFKNQFRPLDSLFIQSGCDHRNRFDLLCSPQSRRDSADGL